LGEEQSILKIIINKEVNCDSDIIIRLNYYKWFEKLKRRHMNKYKIHFILSLGIVCLAVLTLAVNISTESHITVTGTNAGAVSTTITGGGFINVVNNGAYVTATETGTGTINIVNNGAVVTVANTGNGVVTVNNMCTAAVAVTNTGNGNIRVNATGTKAIILTYTDGRDHTYGADGVSTSDPPAESSHITVSGKNAADVAPVITGGGYIKVVNNGARVAATQTGLGTIKITNNGGLMAATNTGTGLMTIANTCTAAVAVTNTGNGNITVNATGTTPIALTYTDGFDHVYP
jgi:hypothetical protein